MRTRTLCIQDLLQQLKMWKKQNKTQECGTSCGINKSASVWIMFLIVADRMLRLCESICPPSWGHCWHNQPNIAQISECVDIRHGRSSFEEREHLIVMNKWTWGRHLFIFKDIKTCSFCGRETILDLFTEFMLFFKIKVTSSNYLKISSKT